MSHNSKTFCLHPFTGLATREDGAIQVCCRSHPVGFIQDQTLEEIWNSDNMIRIRKQVLNHERPPECAPCFKLEDQGVESLRQRHIKGDIPEARINLYPNALAELDKDYKMPFTIPTMELKLNNLCNLKCRMCHPMDSTSWNDWSQVEEFYIKENNFMVKTIQDLKLMESPYLDKFTDNPNWWASLEKLLPYFRRVEFAGGEPLTDPTHYRILEMLQPYAKNIEIKYATNLTSLGKGKHTVFQYWPAFKSVAVNVSIDGLEDSYEYIRGNAKWLDLITNIEQIQKIPNVSRIVGAVAVQVSNILILDRMIEYFLDKLGIIFYTNMVQYPNVLSIQSLPNELKKLAINRLQISTTKLSTYKYSKLNPMILKITLEQIYGIINFLQQPTSNDSWQDCIEFNRRLDVSRNQSFVNVTPEFKAYV
jgi:sulfatase maturation enzyme AslB (radical SAM superfamily)